MRKILFFLAIGTLVSCEEETPDENEMLGRPPVEWVGYGTSFGECLGYCISQLDVSEDTVQFVKYSWTDDLSYPDIKCGDDFTEWDSLSHYLKDFAYFDTVFGCPDCADGGSEWIEVIKGTHHYRATFEFMNEPEEFTKAVEVLRGTMTSFDDCE